MPGPFTHIYTARRVSELMANQEGFTSDFIRDMDGPLLDIQQLDPDLLAGLEPAECAAKMQAWPKFTALGSNGPDLFFFLQDYNNIAIPCDEIMLAMSLMYYLDDQGRLDDPYAGLVDILGEVSQTWAAILRFIIKLDQLWKKFMAVWNATIGPIVDAAGKVIDDLTGGLLRTLGQAFTELANDLLALAAEEILSEGDVFGWFSLKMRKGFDEQAFLWSDMTHYRRTSMVPARMIAHARDMLRSDDAATREHADQLIAFALGWVCHVGTDVVAHSFVNEQCGGPFRTHWQRHHLIENHIDAFNYEQTKPGGLLPADEFCGFQDTYPGLNQSALYFALQIPQGIDGLPQAAKQGALRQPLPEGDDQASQNQRKALLDTDGALPPWLAETIVQVFIEVYAHPSEGGLVDLENKLGEGDQPHPRNLLGQPFQDGLHLGTSLIGKWLGILGVDNAGMALDDIRKQIAPDAPFTVPEGFPMPWEVQAAYRFMLSWFKRSYVSQFDMDKPQRPTVFTPPASDLNNLGNDFSGPPDFSGVNPNDDPLSQLCEAIASILDWANKVLQDAGQFIYDLVKTAASAGTWPVREAIYDGIIEPAWEVCENLRRVLVHMGYLMPQSGENWPDGELRKPSEIDLELITLGHTVDSAFKQALAAAWDPLGNLDSDPALTDEGLRDPIDALNPWLPVRTTKGQKPPNFGGIANDDAVEYQRPWAFPDRTNDPDPKKAGNYLEAPLTAAGPYPQDTMPNRLLSTTAPTSNAARVDYEGAGCPSDTDSHNSQYIQHPSRGQRGESMNPLGDPAVFSAYLIGQIANNPRFIANFNLDADRGYAYLCWDWDRMKAGQDAPKDGQLHPFPPPVVWPEGADAWVRPDPVPVDTDPQYANPLPLQLHYPGRECNVQSEPRIQ
ncbi:zinc dependent phospholipase C family protein [Arthrobacter livingstonensis]|nr:zinc dependent phospholipase C family protein [Arthrobacter livingstonensis]